MVPWQLVDRRGKGEDSKDKIWLTDFNKTLLLRNNIISIAYIIEWFCSWRRKRSCLYLLEKRTLENPSCPFNRVLSTVGIRLIERNTVCDVLFFNWVSRNSSDNFGSMFLPVAMDTQYLFCCFDCYVGYCCNIYSWELCTYLFGKKNFQKWGLYRGNGLENHND